MAKSKKPPVIEIAASDGAVVVDEIVMDLPEDWWREETAIPIEGTQAVKALDMIWAPVTCSTHIETGFNSTCTSCLIQWGETRSHIDQVRKDRQL